MTTRGIRLVIIAGAALAVGGVLAGARRQVAKPSACGCPEGFICTTRGPSPLAYDPGPATLMAGSVLQRAPVFATSPAGTTTFLTGDGTWSAPSQARKRRRVGPDCWINDQRRLTCVILSPGDDFFLETPQLFSRVAVNLDGDGRVMPARKGDGREWCRETARHCLWGTAERSR